MRVTIDKDNHILYNGLRSNHILADGTMIQIECDSHTGDPVCWYRMINNGNGWGVLQVLDTKEVKRLLKLGGER